MQNHHTADGSSSIFISICATLGNFGTNMLMHLFSLTLKYTRPLCQLWMSFVFPKTGAPVEMFTFSLLLILVNLNKGNFNGDTLCYHYPHEHRGIETRFYRHENKTFPLLRVLSAHISCRSPQYSALSDICSVVFKAWESYEKLNINIS